MNQGPINSAIAQTVKENILVNGVTQLVKEMTRHPVGVQVHEPSLLDHFYTTRADKINKVDVIRMGGSDHAMIVGDRKTKQEINKPKYIERRMYKNFSKENFMMEINKIKWLDLYLCEDVERAVELFTEKITTILDQVAPVKRIQLRRNYCPWISKDTGTNGSKR